ncbi:zinc finger-like domain-containing protein, partial [bacterium]|nr:zinc finger-like domain-containing protein [bacterium]
MILTEDQVKEFAKQKEADKWIEESREVATFLRMHYYGTGLTEYLTQIQSLENETQVKLRRKYAISNQALLDSLFRPVDNAWSAKGGLISVDASEDTQDKLHEDIKESLGGGTIKDYLRNFWFDRFVTDPNGLIFMEVDDVGKTFPTYKSIYHIRKMEVKGVTPEYIVFEPHEIEEGETVLGKPTKHDIKWIVDDAFYYKVKLSGDDAIILDQIPNSFGEVPAVQNSLIFDTETGVKISPIHKQSDLLSSYLIDNSINNIYKKLHGFPVFWFYTGKCESCKGTGDVGDKVCKSCNGSGQSMKRDVSDGIPLKTPKNAESPTIAPNVAGYIQPDLETWREQRTELDHLFNLIYYSMWGSTVERV